MQKTPTSFEKVILLSIDRKIKKKEKKKETTVKEKRIMQDPNKMQLKWEKLTVVYKKSLHRRINAK